MTICGFNPHARLATIVAGALALLALAAMTLPAAARAEADFSQCPLENPAVEGCVYSEVTGGEFKVGNSTVPVSKTIILQGGFFTDFETGATTFVDAKNGESLSKTALPVPGGLAGLVNCKEISDFILRAACEWTFENALTGVTATAEQVGDIGYSLNNFSNREGPAITLPVQVKLSNPFLGDNCHIGSASDPITLQLTTGTTDPPPPAEPISGETGEVTFSNRGKRLHAEGFRLVDNAFSAPGVNGCGGLFAPILDPIVDLKQGLPSAAGKNVAIQTGNVDQAARSLVE
jgi:hypothetical protein